MKRNLEQWLSCQNTYTLHKPVRNKFTRTPYTVTDIDDVWEMYLADLSSLSKYNDKYKYVLYVIDIFLRYGCSVPLKDKAGTSNTSNFKYSFQNRKPITTQSEFLMQQSNST